MIEETRTLPCAVGPEKSVISSILQEPDEFLSLAVELGVSSDTFYMPANRTLFGVLLELHSKGKDIEIVSLVQTLLDRGLLDRCGGAGEIAGLLTYSPSHWQFRQHVETIKTKWIGRQILNVAAESTCAVYDSPDEILETLDDTERRIMAIREGLASVSEVTTRQSVGAVLERFEARIRNEPTALGLMTGYDEFDRMTSGLNPGEMAIIAARPSVGKSALMLNMAEYMSVSSGVPGLIFSAEMPRESCVQRIVMSRARFAMSDLSRGYNPNKGDLQRIQRAAIEVADSPLHFDETSGPSVEYMRAKARRAKREHGIKYLMCDYLQLCKSNSKQAQFSREREIAEISAGMRSIGKELGIPVVILAQLNRGPSSQSAKSKPRQPRMSDLRESGSIEQDADIIALLTRADYEVEDAEERAESTGHAELILAKNRNGETGHIPLTWIADLMRFETGKPIVEESGDWNRFS